MYPEPQRSAISESGINTESVLDNQIKQYGSIDLYELFKILLKKIHPLYNVECAAILIYNKELNATTQAYLSTYYAETGEIKSLIYAMPVILNSVQREIASYEYPVLKSRESWESDGESNQTLLNGETHYQYHCYIPLEVDNNILGTFELHNNISKFSKESLTFCSNIADLFAEAIINAGSIKTLAIPAQDQLKDFAIDNNELTVIDLLQDLSVNIASVRTAADLQAVINNKLAKLSFFHDLLIAKPISGSEFYHFAFFNSESTRLSDNVFVKIVNAEYNVRDGIYDNVIGGNGPAIVNIPDLLEKPLSPDFLKYWKHHQVKQLVGAPLKNSKEQYGILLLPTFEAETLDESQMFLIKSVSSQICVALANIQIQDSLLKRQRDRELLLSLAKDLASAKNRNDIGALMSKKLKLIINYDHAEICIFHAGGEPYRNFYSTLPGSCKPEGSSEITDSSQSSDNDFLNEFRNNTSPVVIDLFAGSEYEPNKNFQNWRAQGIKQVIALSLDIANDIIGAIFICMKKPLFPDDEAKDLLRGVSSQIAIAAWNILCLERINTQLAEISNYKKQLESENLYLQEEIVIAGNYDEIVGSGAEMQQVFRLLDQVSGSESTVLILGETGTGKELIARAVHQSSGRRDKLMIKVNCAAIPPNLIESELFGHEKGAFTGATERRIGKFELANNSTLFLDEIGELPLDLQVKLLRVLQEKEFERVGGKSTLTADVRIISATNRNLLEEVEAGRFRRDLYYRLNVFPIPLPPLRSRKHDIPLLASHFLERYARKSGKKLAGFSQKVLKDMLNYHWPGNIRELEHLIERQVLLASGPLIKELEFPARTNNVIIDDVVQRVKTIAENERDHIYAVLKVCKGKISGQDGAAKLLGVPATTLNSKIKKLGLTKKLISG